MVPNWNRPGTPGVPSWMGPKLESTGRGCSSFLDFLSKCGVGCSKRPNQHRGVAGGCALSGHNWEAVASTHKDMCMCRRRACERDRRRWSRGSAPPIALQRVTAMQGARCASYWYCRVLKLGNSSLDIRGSRLVRLQSALVCSQVKQWHRIPLAVAKGKQHGLKL